MTLTNSTQSGWTVIGSEGWNVMLSPEPCFSTEKWERSHLLPPSQLVLEKYTTFERGKAPLAVIKSWRRLSLVKKHGVAPFPMMWFRLNWVETKAGHHTWYIALTSTQYDNSLSDTAPLIYLRRSSSNLSARIITGFPPE